MAREDDYWREPAPERCPRWEYVVVYDTFLTTRSQVAWLNEMGANGWQLVNRDRESSEYIFKRERRD